MFGPLAAAQIQNPRHVGPLGGPCLYGVSGVPGDGPYVEIWARVEDGILREAAYRSPGCPSSTAAAGVLCEISIGREVERVLSLDASDLMIVLGGLPEGKGHWTARAVEAMRNALGEGEETR